MQEFNTIPFKQYRMRISTVLWMIIAVLVIFGARMYWSLYEDAHAKYIQVSMKSSVRGVAQIFYDIGQGVTEKSSSTTAVHANGEFSEYRFSFPDKKKIYNLRFDPLASGGHVEIRQIRITDGLGNTFVGFHLTQLVPSNQISRLEIINDHISMDIDTNADDPQSYIRLAEPLLPMPEVHPSYHKTLLLSFCLILLSVSLIYLWVNWIDPKNILTNRLNSNPWFWLGAVILLTAFMWCYRRPDALIHPQFWAEDGVIFFADAYHHGFSSLWMDHGGYYHLVPRVAALLGLSLIPLVFQPLFYNLFCLFGIMAIISYLWFRLPFSPGKKFFMALSLTWAPVANEVLWSLAGFHFILSLCPIILLLGGPPKNALGWFIDSFVLLICGLTGPFLTLLFPLLLLVAWENKFQPRSYYISLVIIAGLTIFPQAFTLATPSIKRLSLDQPLMLVHILRFFYLQAIGLFFSPNWFKNDILLLVASITVAFAYLGGGIYFVKNVLKTRNWSILTPLLAALIILSATILLYGSAIILLNPVEGGPRYFYIPTVMILWTAILGWPQKYLRWMAVLFVYFLVFYSIAYSSKPLLVTDAYKWPDYASRITTEKELNIPINPTGWFIKIQNQQASVVKVGETNSNQKR